MQLVVVLATSQAAPTITVAVKLSLDVTFASEALLIWTAAVSVIGHEQRAAGSRLESSSVLNV